MNKDYKDGVTTVWLILMEDFFFSLVDSFQNLNMGT